MHVHNVHVEDPLRDTRQMLTYHISDLHHCVRHGQFTYSVHIHSLFSYSPPRAERTMLPRHVRRARQQRKQMKCVSVPRQYN